MSEPFFLDFQAVEKLHCDSLAKFGGSPGVRDQPGIESAIAAAMNCYAYANGDLFDIAATYAFHIAQAQAFLDGNKRTGVAAALSFLQINDVIVWPEGEDLYQAMIAIAEKRLDKAGLVELFRRASNSAS